jgi:hypothetical protein
MFVAAIAATTMVTASCSNSPSSSDQSSSTTRNSSHVEKNGSGERGADLEPLVKRFAALGAPISATWYSGTLGDDDVPGPTSYWIDAVVVLEPAATDSLISKYSAVPTDTRPETVPDLTGDLPSGELLRSPALDAEFSTTFSTQVWISRESGQVVLTARGQ